MPGLVVVEPRLWCGIKSCGAVCKESGAGTVCFSENRLRSVPQLILMF